MSKEIVDMNKEMASCSLNKRNINKELASCSVNKRLPGVPCTTHTIFVDAGEDIISIISSVKGSHRVHIISASGDVSNVTLLHPADVGSTTCYTTTYYEGVFTIGLLTGTFPENDDAMATVTLSMAGRDSRAGVVVGELRAASPIEVSTGFMWDVEDDD